jgi:hypothetical protein
MRGERSQWFAAGGFYAAGDRAILRGVTKLPRVMAAYWAPFCSLPNKDVLCLLSALYAGRFLSGA